MESTISLVLGILSVGLGTIALWQARQYKKLSDKFDTHIEQILNLLRDSSTYTAMTTRSINNELKPESSKIVLSKDELYVYINHSKYNPSNLCNLIDKLNTELPSVLKRPYIDTIISALNTINEESSPIVTQVTLRHQYENYEDFQKIRNLNTIFQNDGIYFELIIR